MNKVRNMFADIPESERRWYSNVTQLTQTVCVLMNERDMSEHDLARELGCDVEFVRQFLGVRLIPTSS